jgi:hypothetical protein
VVAADGLAPTICRTLPPLGEPARFAGVCATYWFSPHCLQASSPLMVLTLILILIFCS